MGNFGGYIKSFLRISADLIISTVIIIYLLSINFIIVLSLLGIFLILFLIYNFIFLEKVRNYGKKSNIANELMIQGINEGVYGFKELRILNLEKQFLNIVKTNAKNITTNAFKFQAIQSIPRYLIEFFLILFIFIGLLIFYIFSETEIITIIPILGIFILACLRLMPLTTQIIASITTMKFSTDALEKLYNIIFDYDYKKSYYDYKNKTLNDTNDTFNNLKIENISFDYQKKSKSNVK